LYIKDFSNGTAMKRQVSKLVMIGQR